jgi:hypothetical protein
VVSERVPASKAVAVLVAVRGGPDVALAAPRACDETGKEVVAGVGGPVRVVLTPEAEDLLGEVEGVGVHWLNRDFGTLHEVPKLLHGFGHEDVLSPWLGDGT